MFKKIVGLTPAIYRNAEMYYSFEPIRLYERITYNEDKEQSELFPDVKVIRFMPDKMYAYLHSSKQEEGMENEAFRIVSERLDVNKAARHGSTKLRIFGYNVDLPDEYGEPRYGYRVLITDGDECMSDDSFTREPFVGGLYAVRKINTLSPKIVQEGWNRLLSEWLPNSTFEIGTHQYVEEFIAYNDKITRMHLYLPLQRRYQSEIIEVVVMKEVKVFFCREYGAGAQALAERRLIDWYDGRSDETWRVGQSNYYMSFDYGNKDSDEYWWENGILKSDPESPGLEELEEKHFRSGSYACCVSKTYGLLTGVLDKMHRWVASNEDYRLDEERQWFAEYHTFEGMNIERDSIVKVYIPII